MNAPVTNAPVTHLAANQYYYLPYTDYGEVRCSRLKVLCKHHLRQIKLNKKMMLSAFCEHSGPGLSTELIVFIQYVHGNTRAHCPDHFS